MLLNQFNSIIINKYFDNFLITTQIIVKVFIKNAKKFSPNQEQFFSTILLF